MSTAASPSVSPSASPPPVHSPVTPGSNGTDGKKDESSVSVQAEASSSSKGQPTDDNGVQSTESGATPPTNDWQAIFSPAHNAYYFYNMRTNETTWENPLQSQAQASTSALPFASTPVAASSTSASPEPQTSSLSPDAATAQLYALQAAAVAQGIDPSLAYLDPSLATSSSSGMPSAYTYTAKFNARTGAFTKPDAREPGHLGEYERMKRMSDVYFDVGAWEASVVQEQEGEEQEGKKRKRPTKKDLERFKEQKKQKKIAKTAWLRT